MPGGQTDLPSCQIFLLVSNPRVIQRILKLDTVKYFYFHKEHMK